MLAFISNKFDVDPCSHSAEIHAAQKFGRNVDGQTAFQLYIVEKGAKVAKESGNQSGD